jgi:hypothetical protein
MSKKNTAPTLQEKLDKLTNEHNTAINTGDLARAGDVVQERSALLQALTPDEYAAWQLTQTI